MTDFHQWLTDNGFERYATLFASHHIDFDALPTLSEQDLRELEIPIGDRKRLLRAIAGRSVPIAVERAEAERRQLTLMFCDIVESTQLAQRLDPEDLQGVLRTFRDCVNEAIQRFDGYRAAFLGDGVLAYFGYPQAHEDDAERSIRTALAIIEAVAGLNTRLDVNLKVRTGIATGMVVVGAMTSGRAGEEAGVVGTAPNLAARLQGVAQPGWVVIGEATRRLAGAHFDYEDLGEQALKGFSEPIRAWRVLRERRWDTRFRASQASGLAAMVGREPEMRLLRGCWDEVRQGRGQAVFLGGDPGMGKSRLVEALHESLGTVEHGRMQWQCSPLYGDSALYPALRHLEQEAGFAEESAPERRLASLAAVLTKEAPPNPVALAFLCEMLALPGPRIPPELAGRRAKEEGLAGIVAYVTGTARIRPLLLVLEDVHWADPTTRELLDLLVAAAADVPLLLLVTHRPEFQPPADPPAHVRSHRLERLDHAEVAKLVTDVAGGKTMPDGLLAQIETKTDGVPLFVQELTKAVIESGWLAERGGAYEVSSPAIEIPSTLRDSLMARLDRTRTAKEIAQIGAVIGRDFSYDLLLAASQLDDQALRYGLRKLMEAELIRRGDDDSRTDEDAFTQPRARFAFRHALMQEAAYESLLKATRQRLHQRIATVIEERFPDRKETEPELLAHHYAAADRAGQAIPFWIRAAQNAAGRWALVEAINHWQRALAAIGALPDAGERDRMELMIRTGLGKCYLLLKGWAASEIHASLAPALDLARRIGDLPSLFQVLRGLWTYHLTRAEHAASLDLVRQMLDTAEQTRDDVASVTAAYAGAASHFMTGDLTGARTHGDRVLSIYDPERHRDIVWSLNTDPKCSTYLWASYWLWLLGAPDEAARVAEERDGLARKLNHPFNLCFDLTVGSVVFVLRGEPERALRANDEAMAVAREQRLVLVTHLLGPLYRAAALLEAGAAEDAWRLSQASLEVWRRSGGRLIVPFHWSVQARALMRLGRHGDAAERISSALALVEDSQERWMEPELLRLRGCLQLHAGARSDAMASFHHALAVARRQGAVAWELRAAMSLGEVLADDGRRAEATTLLQPCYARFTEGRDTADLKRARALLDAWA